MNINERITIDRQVMTGKPIVKGTDIPVEQILRDLAGGTSIEGILEAYPHLTREDIGAALEYAANAVERVGAEEARKQPIGLEELRQNYREAILELARKRKATNVRVFGSVVRGESTGESDVDFLVDFEVDATLWDQIGLRQDLEELLGREVDLSVEKNLREEFRPHIMRDATPL